jgi:hypothetical protein
MNVKRKVQEARNRAGIKLTANNTESWKVRALTYVEKQLADGHELSRRVAQILHDVPEPRPELIAALSGAAPGFDRNMKYGGIAQYKDSLGLLKSRLNEYLDEPLTLVVFEHFLARASDPVVRLHPRLALVDGNDVYFAAALPNDVDEAYNLASSFRTTVFCLQGIGIEQIRRADDCLDVTAAAEHTISVYASAYDHEAFIGVRIR